MTEDSFSTPVLEPLQLHPLNLTDPSGYCFLGYFWKPLFKAIGNFLQP